MLKVGQTVRHRMEGYKGKIDVIYDSNEYESNKVHKDICVVRVPGEILPKHVHSSELMHDEGLQDVIVRNAENVLMRQWSYVRDVVGYYVLHVLHVRHVVVTINGLF